MATDLLDIVGISGIIFEYFILLLMVDGSRSGPGIIFETFIPLITSKRASSR